LELKGPAASTSKLDALSKLLPLHRRSCNMTEKRISSFLDHFFYQ
jgi:hypothetical protein